MSRTRDLDKLVLEDFLRELEKDEDNPGAALLTEMIGKQLQQHNQDVADLNALGALLKKDGNKKRSKSTGHYV